MLSLSKEEATLSGFLQYPPVSRLPAAPAFARTFTAPANAYMAQNCQNGSYIKI
jgi:hypothetical protein